MPEYDTFQNVRDSLSMSSETDSEEESKHPNYRKKQSSRKSKPAAEAKVPFTKDNLIERPGKVLQSLFNSFTANQQ